MSATLKSRIPQITTAIPLRVKAALNAGTEAIAAEAAANAPEGATGELKKSIEARESGIAYGGRSRFATSGAAEALGYAVPLRPKDQVHDKAYGIWAAWYYHFPEFGTVHASAQPFLMPAVEAGTPALVAGVQASLRAL